ncbi:glycosyltransferase [Rhizobium sp. CECT 9324]|uniref:glycosyltransferase n=1 Tax=Rhizobium sp. CECT 9324 TaxID=2845820 RepID=UPI001E5F42D1|nr:glycosyltransferase [Rhizobium sp. CECT 9324]CAH0343194.1 D-inositol-3-phosphate glycosyltransferase [Rhizobium sp. CECT 9324]
MTENRRLKVLRVVTVAECVPWHLGPILRALKEKFEVTVAGDGVSRYASQYPGVCFVDIRIARKADPLRDLIAAYEIYRLCRKISPDVVHSIMPKAGMISAVSSFLARVPVRLHTFTGQVWDTKKGIPRWIYRNLDMMIVWLNTSCLTDSPSQSRHLFQEGVHYKGRPLRVLGKGSLVGVDLQRFDADRLLRESPVSRMSLEIADNDFVVAYIARKSRDKGAFDMLRSFAQARKKRENLKLLYIGPDETEGKLDQLKFEEPELFHGVLERGSVSNHEEYLAVSDLLCVPSYREGFGSIVVDAGAVGVPALGSKIKGLVDSISDGETGLLFEAGDIIALSNLICDLADDRHLLQELGSRAQARVQTDFSSVVVGKRLSDFYQEETKRAFQR